MHELNAIFFNLTKFCFKFVYKSFISENKNKKQRYYQQKSIKTQQNMTSNRSVRSNSSRKSSIVGARTLNDVPRVEIFLDANLNKAINKIKAEVSGKKSQSKQPQFNKSPQQPTQQHFKPLIKSKIKSLKSTENSDKITLMPNEVVLDYIKQVYTKYGIKNPLEGYLDFNQKVQIQYLKFQKSPSFSDKKQTFTAQKTGSIKTYKKSKKISQNQAKILQLKSRFKDQIENQQYEEESTIKKISNLNQQSENAHFIDFTKRSQGDITYIDHLTHLIQSQEQDTFDFQNDTTVNNTGLVQESTPERSFKNIHKFNKQNPKDWTEESPSVMKPKKKLFVKTKQRAVSRNFSSLQTTPDHYNYQKNVCFDLLKQQSQNLFSEQKNKQASIRYLKIQEKQDQVTTSMNQTLINQPIVQESLIPQVYRYCLGCEQAILNQNISFHQNKCNELKKLYQLPLQQLQRQINSKIERIKLQIYQSELFKLKDTSIQQIRQKTQKWLFEQKNKQIPAHDKWANFRKLENLLANKLLTGCQLIKKLQWFISLRQNFDQHLSSAPTSGGQNWHKM